MKKSFSHYAFIVFSVVVTANAMLQFYFVASNPADLKNYGKAISFVALMFPATFLLAYLGFSKSFRNQRTLYWYMDATANQLKHLEARLLTPASEPAPIHASKWPWGNRSTKALDDMAAAAEKFWAFYDPTRTDTAPLNESVSDWLRTERGVTKEKAQAIASILRADGLRTGPR